MSSLRELVQKLAALPVEQRNAVLAGLEGDELQAIMSDWPTWARPDQLPPPGDWRVWLLLGGRGSGKTRTASEWIRAEVESGRRARLAIVGPTSEAIRRTQIESDSGILRISSNACRPIYESSLNRLTWPNGAVAHLYSAEEPDRLRGPNLDGAAVDELCAFGDPDGRLATTVMDMLQLATRLPGPTGIPARILISTTPKPMQVLKDIIANPTTIVTRSRTLDNSANLDSGSLRYLVTRYGGTALGRQELDAELLDQAEGALWTRALIEDARVQEAPEQHEIRRIVVAIDPSGGSTAANSETGLIVACRTTSGHGYVLADASGRYSPQGWAERAIALYHEFGADRIVAEQNFGGAMVESTLRTINRGIPLKMVVASEARRSVLSLSWRFTSRSAFITSVYLGPLRISFVSGAPILVPSHPTGWTLWFGLSTNFWLSSVALHTLHGCGWSGPPDGRSSPCLTLPSHAPPHLA